MPGGKPGTIAERALQRQTAGAGGVFTAGGGAGAGGGMDDILSSIQTIMTSQPTKSPLEGKLAIASGMTAENTQKTAEATQTISLTQASISLNLKCPR